MKVQLLGVQTLQFKTDSGNLIEGHNLYIGYTDENVSGMKASKIFVNKSVALPQGLKQGSMLEIAFNMKGKPEKIELIK